MDTINKSKVKSHKSKVRKDIFSKYKKRWVVEEEKSDDIIEQILINRKIEKVEWEKFLCPDYEKDLHDPFLLKGMNEAVARVRRAIKDKEKVGIMGDFDADGIPGSAVLREILVAHGLNCEVYIPAREEGYGLSIKGIEFFKKCGVTLVITVDLGIAEREGVKKTTEMGMDVIVTDHHEVRQGFLPKEAVAIINPMQKSCRYPFKDLSGAAVAFKLACAISQSMGRISQDKLKWMLDLVAISTFCDMVPLTGENRVLGKYGLIVLNKTRRVGLRQMYELSGWEGKPITPYTVGFMIGPRINAPGRMGEKHSALEFLITEDSKMAREIVEEMEQINRRRQEMLKKIFDEADERVTDKGLDKKKVIMIDGEGWPEGIVGLVAGRLLEKYFRPVVVVGWKGEVGKGSGRSIEGFHIVEALNECEDYLIKHGGHAKAAGLTVAREHIEVLYDRLLKVAEKRLKDEDLVPEIRCDGLIDIEKVNWKLWGRLEKLEPYGLGNQRPIFLSEGVRIEKVGVVGNGAKHLKLVLGAGEGKYLDAIGFDMGERAGELSGDGRIDIIYTIDRDEWRGDKNLQLKILDFRK